jgi:hypothetical protein
MEIFARAPRPAQSQRNVIRRRLGGCVGCGRRTRAFVCQNCRHTDSRYGTRVLAPGEICALCYALGALP